AQTRMRTPEAQLRLKTNLRWRRRQATARAASTAAASNELPRMPEHPLPSLSLCLASGERATSMSKACTPSGATPLVAVIVTLTVVLASLLVGVPLNSPVVALKLSQAGSTLVTLSDGVG